MEYIGKAIVVIGVVWACAYASVELQNGGMMLVAFMICAAIWYL